MMAADLLLDGIVEPLGEMVPEYTDSLQNNLTTTKGGLKALSPSGIHGHLLFTPPGIDIFSTGLLNIEI